MTAMESFEQAVHHKSMHEISDDLHAEKTDCDERENRESFHRYVYFLVTMRMRPSCTTDTTKSPSREKMAPPANPRAFEVEIDVWS